MVDEQTAWSRLDGEPNFWWQRFERFRLLGPDRSLTAAYNRWRAERVRESPLKPARNSPKPWRNAAERWNWRERAEAWDEFCRARVSAEAEAERLSVLSSGYAQQHERVRRLGEVAELLLTELSQHDRRWLRDVKGVGSGAHFQEVEIERFNTGILEEFRKYLEDIAAEMGERVQRHKVEVDQPPLVVIDK